MRDWRGYVGGLRILPTDGWAALKAGGAAALAVAVALTIVDAVLFRTILPPEYVAYFTAPDVAARILIYMASSILEDLQVRLLLMTALVAAGVAAFGARTAVYVAAIVLAQSTLIVLKVPRPEGMVEASYHLLRFFVPGLVWGWLYWRQGFVVSTLAHAVTHIPFQNLLLRALT